MNVHFSFRCFATTVGATENFTGSSWDIVVKNNITEESKGESRSCSLIRTAYIQVCRGYIYGDFIAVTEKNPDLCTLHSHRMQDFIWYRSALSSEAPSATRFLPLSENHILCQCLMPISSTQLTTNYNSFTHFSCCSALSHRAGALFHCVCEARRSFCLLLLLV